METVFICERPDEDREFAQRLEGDLTARLGGVRVRRAAADDTECLRDAAVLLVVIGCGWLDARDDAGHRRLERPDDPVRRRIEFALDHALPIVPVLVGGAHMPWPDQLPDGLSSFAGRQAFTLRQRQWDEDIDALLGQLGALSPALAAVMPDTVPAARTGHALHRGIAGWLMHRLGRLF